MEVSRTLKSISDIPVLPGLPILGNLLASSRDSQAMFLQALHQCGEIGVINLGPRKMIMLNEPHFAQQVLVEQAAKVEKSVSFRLATAPIIGNGLLTSENEFHKRQRKLVAPMFQHRYISNYADIMVDYTEHYQRRWLEGATINIAQEMMLLTLQIVGKTLFDANDIKEAEQIGEAITTSLHTASSRLGSLINLPLSWPTPQHRHYHASIATLDEMVYRFINRRRESQSERNDVLSLLLQARDQDDGSFMTDKQVRDEIITMFLAGHETTANALSWTWYLLAEHPDVCSCFYEEIDSVLAGRTPVLSDLARLPYTLQIFKEAMRLYPPAPFIGRMTKEPIEIGGYAIPANTFLAISIYALHRHPKYFPDPERFDPRRFIPDAERHLPRHAYMPFGAGPRICIGNHFAMMEGHLLLATLAQHIRFALEPGQRIEPMQVITLRPKNGIRMTVHRRTRRQEKLEGYQA